VLAVGSGMVSCARYYFAKIGATLLQFPLLYHAIRKPLFWRTYDVPSSQDVIRYLLTQSCHPNEKFQKNMEELTTTLWRDWLRELHRMDSDRFFDSVAVIEEFIKGDTDLCPINLEPMNAILQRHLNKTKTSTAEGRQQVKKRTQLLDLVKDKEEQMANKLVVQHSHQIFFSTSCHGDAGSFTQEESRKRKLSDNDGLQARTKIPRKQ
jgi:hypothetical protein